jgi:hypothetical protein
LTLYFKKVLIVSKQKEKNLLIKIKICDVAPKSACSYYRGIGPFSKLHKLNNLIDVEFVENMNWNHLINCDILYLVRPVENNYIEVLKTAQDFGVKVWIDYDDCLPEIPADNPSYNYFTQEYILDNINYAIKNADIVSVSSEHIKQYFSKINPNIIVIENAFNDYNYKFEKKENNTKVISWRGSATHRNDLLSCKIEMVDVSTKFPEWEWVFLGGDPWYISESINNSISIGELEIIKYNKIFSGINPAIHLIPLVESDFNKSKSNIAWIEATWTGAVCIAPNYLPEFKKPGILNYNENFGYLIEKAIKSKSFRQENYNQSFEYIHDNLLLSKINQKRIQIIEEQVKN